jgi:hypothetical protein
MTPTKPNRRRNFLLAAAMGGAGVAAAVVAGTKPVKGDADVAAADDPKTRTAYRETPHILKYYKTTEV